ncbi:tryptophan transporter [Fictibacillus sp. Mic-4]|uniref:tryptophan transporter n=1 Tax=Fictibacillus TaxID=1329200 RepID=UPI0003FAAB45|nr:tryptophan transporter [Fictibacillus gelatini]
MKTKFLALTGVLLALGFVLHTVMPAFFLGMRPDMLLVMMFLSIILFPNITNVLTASIATGAIAAITTSFPGGQVANMVDKPVTAIIFLSLFLLVSKYKINALSVSLLAAIGTMVSGSVFLLTALLTVGLPGSSSFLALFATVVLPATVLNSAVTVLLFPITKGFQKTLPKAHPLNSVQQQK